MCGSVVLATLSASERLSVEPQPTNAGGLFTTFRKVVRTRSLSGWLHRTFALHSCSLLLGPSISRGRTCGFVLSRAILSASWEAAGLIFSRTSHLQCPGGK